MKLNLSWRPPRLTLANAYLLDRNFSSPESLPLRSTSIDLPLVSTPPLETVFDYRIFPPHIMRSVVSWADRPGGMSPGDLIIQRVFIPPIGCGICLEFAVRIVSVSRTGPLLGFSYETLLGHPESGIAEFILDTSATPPRFTIRTRSQPGHWLARLLNRIFSTPYQAWCTWSALRTVRSAFETARLSPMRGAGHGVLEK